MAKKIKTYSESIDEINEIIKQIENEELDVDMLSENVERVYELIKICREKLTKTEETVDKIIKNIE